MAKHISETLLEKLDRQLGEAIRDVEKRTAEKASVGLAFTVGRDKEDNVVVQFRHKAATQEGGSWEPPYQPSLFESVDQLNRMGARVEVTQAAG